jgi:putative acetyltransferase
MIRTCCAWRSNRRRLPPLKVLLRRVKTGFSGLRPFALVVRPVGHPCVMSVDVRPEAPTDVGDVRGVHERAFAPSHEEADLVDALRASGVSVPELCLVAVRAGAVVGHIAFSRARLDSGHAVPALAAMGVLPAHQRQGVGSALVSEGLGAPLKRTSHWSSVVGRPEYYPRFGFEPADALGVVTPFAVPARAWMVHRLPAYRPDARGTVAYPEAFPSLT